MNMKFVILIYYKNWMENLIFLIYRFNNVTFNNIKYLNIK